MVFISWWSLSLYTDGLYSRFYCTFTSLLVHVTDRKLTGWFLMSRFFFLFFGFVQKEESGACEEAEKEGDKEAEKNSEEDKEKDDTAPEEIVAGSHSFQNMMEGLPEKLSTNMAKNLSVPIAFVCLLHLANEKVCYKINSNFSKQIANGNGYFKT